MLKDFDTCFNSQRIFRMVLDSMSRPGKVNNINNSPKETDVYEYDSLLKVLITLLDNEVSFNMSPKMSEKFNKDVTNYTGSKISEIQLSDFYIARGDDTNDEISVLKNGSLVFPDESCTIVMAVNEIYKDESSYNQNSIKLKLMGPGIKDCSFVAMDGLNVQNIELIKQKNIEYPLGVDAILVDVHGNVLCLPRTVKIELEVN